MLIKKETKEVRPCVKCKESHMIYNHSKHLCRSCEKEAKKEKNLLKSGFSSLSDLFNEIWIERTHVCVKCGVWLGNEPKPIYFSHIRSKGARIDLKFDKNNIELLCADCHEKWEFKKRYYEVR